MILKIKRHPKALVPRVKIILKKIIDLNFIKHDVVEELSFYGEKLKSFKSQVILQEVLQYFKKSDQKKTREITFTYNDPRHRDIINNYPFLKELKEVNRKWDTIICSNKLQKMNIQANEI